MLGRCGVCGGAGEDSRRDNPSKKGIGASLAFFEYKDGSFIDITESDRPRRQRDMQGNAKK